MKKFRKCIATVPMRTSDGKWAPTEIV